MALKQIRGDLCPVELRSVTLKDGISQKTIL